MASGHALKMYNEQIPNIGLEWTATESSERETSQKPPAEDSDEGDKGLNILYMYNGHVQLQNILIK